LLHDVEGVQPFLRPLPGVAGRRRCREGAPRHDRSQRVHRGLVTFVFALPSWLAFALLLAFPFIYTIGLAFTQSTLGEPFAEWAGLGNFYAALTTQAFAGSLPRTIMFAVSAAVIELLLGTLIALLLQVRGKGLGVAGTILLLPMVTPPIMVGVAWQMLLAPAGGGLTMLWSALGIPGFNAFGTDTLALLSLVLIEAWQWTPFVILMVYLALLTVDQELIEASRLDGANARWRFRSAIYPSIAPVMLTVLIQRMSGIRWRMSHRRLILLKEWVSTPLHAPDQTEPHPPCLRLRPRGSAFQPLGGRKSRLLSMAAA
jgi:multiple sugar transport system permease protein